MDLKKIPLVLLAAVLSAAVYAKDVFIVKNGKNLAAIEYSSKESKPLAFAADELATYLAKISGSQKAAVNGDGKGLYLIKLGTLQDKILAAKCDAKKIAGLKKDGFLIKITAKETVVLGESERGVIYGVYELLKRYTGIRWVVPGDDGEYFTKQSSIKFPEGEFSAGAVRPYRTIFNGRCNADSPLEHTWKWMLRNNMVITHYVNYPGRKSKARELLDSYTDVIWGGGHAFTGLMLDGSGIRNGKKMREQAAKEALYKIEPELFPLIDGKRFLGYSNPCQSNPKVIEYMAKGLCEIIEKRLRPTDTFMIGNDDTTLWCTCEKCKKLTPPDEAAKGFMSTRYWLLVNAVAKKVWEKHPDAKLAGWAYQNFHKYPSGVTPDPRLTVQLTYNNRCYRHALTDPKCPNNKVFHEYFKEWRAKFKNRLITWEQLEYASSYIYQPIEKVFCQNVKDYRKLGVDGPMMTTQPPDGIYQKKWDGHICKEIWYGNWQTFYLGARFLWDDSRNYEKEYEEANSLYYGKAWEGGMKEFRRLLTKYATETPGCAGYGHDNVIGRCLDQPGSKEKLLAALEKAEKAASTPREKLHVARDRKFFSIFWLDARDRYVESYRELRSFDHDKPIVIDGKCDEEDWKKADIVSNFKVFAATEPTVKGKKLSPAKHQTYVRTTYDAAHLYFYLEMMEPSTDKMIARKTKKDEKLWHDNSVELFVWHPDLGESYYHLILNHKGVLYDAKKNPGSRAEDRSWESGLEYRINILKDRWVVECKLPTRNLGMIARHGYVWKINVGRSRFVAGEKAPAHIKRDSIPWELSSMSSGNFHNIANFLPFNMLGKRQLISMRGEGNTAPFVNGNFNKKRKLNKTVIANMAKKGHSAVNNIMPSGWLFNGKNGKLELCSHKENENDCYVKLFNGILYQLHYGDAKNVKIRFRAKSDDGGKLKLNLYRYRMENRKSRKNLPTKTAISALPLEKNWKEYTVTLNKEFDDEVFGIAFIRVAGTVCFDDVVVTEIVK